MKFKKMMKLKITLIILLTAGVCYGAFYNSWNSGQLSPLLKYRIDFEKRNMGVETMENFLVKPQGAAIRRPGTQYIGQVKDSNYAPILLSFDYATGDSYVIEAGDKYFRPFRTVDGNSGLMLTDTDSGLVTDYIAQWKLDDDSDVNTISDTCDTYNGNLLSVDTENVHQTGKIGTGCFNFDGSYAGIIADDSGLSFVETSSPFSITGWIYVINNLSTQAIFSKWDESNSDCEYRFYLDENKRLRFDMADKSQFALDNNCVSQWKFNDRITGDSNVIDSKDEVNGVATTTTLLLSSGGKIGYSFDFTPFSTGPYSVVIDDNDAYSFGDSSDDHSFSISLWFYPVNRTLLQTAISKYSLAGTDSREWRLILNDSDLRFYLYDENAAAYQEIYTTGNAIDYSWQHIIITYDGRGGDDAADGLKMYRNGVLQTTTTVDSGTYTAMDNTDANVVVSGQYDSDGEIVYQWDGFIDNVIIFNKELTSYEIATLYNDGSGTEELSGDYPYVISDDALDDGWNFVGVTYSSAGGVIAANDVNIYVNGAKLDVTRHNYSSYVAMEDTGATVGIGAQIDNNLPVSIFSGRLDNINLYNRELSAAEINSMYEVNVIYELPTIYDKNDLRNIKYVQKNDVVYLVCPNYPPQKLSRYDHTYWTMETVDWQWGPFLTQNITDTTITPSGLTGNITLTASNSVFRPEHIGSIWSIGEKRTDSSVKETFNADGETDSIEIKGKYLLKLTSNGNDGDATLQKSDDDGLTWLDVYTYSGIDSTTDWPIEYTGDEAENGWIYKVVVDYNDGLKIKVALTPYESYLEGYVKITSYVSPTVVNAKVIEHLSGISATKRWSEGAFSDYRGYPQAVCLYQNRLCLAGTSHLPNGFWASSSTDEENMENTGLDNGAIVYEAGSARQNAILWLQDKQGIIAGTSDSILRIFSQSNSSTLTGNTIGSERQNAVGSCSMQAQLLRDSVLFVNRNRRQVFDVLYDLGSESYKSPDLTVFSGDITDSNLMEVAVQNNPDPILWYIKGDGNCVTLSYDKDNSIVAWSEHSTDGLFESAVAITTQTEDEVWFVVKRTVDSNNYRFIEKMKPQDWGSDINDCWFVDCGLKYTGVEANTITGMSYLEGKTVQIFYDGNSCTEANVVDGNIVLDVNISEATIGLGYTSILQTFPIEVGTGGGYSVGYMKQIKEIDPTFIKTMHGKYGVVIPYITTTMYDIEFWKDPDIYLGSYEPFTGIIKIPSPNTNSAYETAVKFVQDEPYPFTITSLTVKVDVGND